MDHAVRVEVRLHAASGAVAARYPNLLLLAAFCYSIMGHVFLFKTKSKFPHSFKQRIVVSDPKQVAERLFARNQRREAEIDEALSREAGRHAAAVENMHRLKALRLAREAELKNEK
jgi:hypothetical protein